MKLSVAIVIIQIGVAMVFESYSSSLQIYRHTFEF